MKQSILLRSPRRAHRRRRLLQAAALCTVTLAAALLAWWLIVVRPGGNGVEPSRSLYPVRGLDLSAHNGKVDFERVAAAEGMEFVLLKATEGHSFKDRAFADNWRRAREAGLRVGAYHFFRFDCTGYMQALNLLESVRGRELDLPLMIDVEEWTNPRDHSTRDVMMRISEMVTTLEAHGYRVMLYSNMDGFERFLSDRFAHYPLWLCNMTERPGAEELRIWQFTHRGRVAGVNGPVDLNVFIGSPEEFRQFK